ncbi:MAG: diacylglycerol kinase family protein [Chloroflexota bacterium]
MLKEWWESIQGTSRINPSDYAAQTSPNRWKSFNYSLAGWLYMLRWQKNTRIMSVASIVVFGVAFWVGISRIEWALLVVTITIVWLTEFLNAGIEAAIDIAAPDIHPMAQVGKDVASAAVLLGVVASVIVGLLILAPPVLVKIGLLNPA